MENKLERFIKAQQIDYKIALEEIKEGRKQTHWVWYIFPQIKGLGFSEMSKYYAIQNIEEAKQYISNTYLYNNLIKICEELLKQKSNNAEEIMGFPDNLKLCSSMTLFEFVEPEQKIFTQVIEKFFDGQRDEKTLEILKLELIQTKIIDTL